MESGAAACSGNRSRPLGCRQGAASRLLIVGRYACRAASACFGLSQRACGSRRRDYRQQRQNDDEGHGCGCSRDLFRVHKTEGNLNNDIGLAADDLQLDDDTEVAVLEMGMSGFGEIELLTGSRSRISPSLPISAMPICFSSVRGKALPGRSWKSYPG